MVVHFLSVGVTMRKNCGSLSKLDLRSTCCAAAHRCCACAFTLVEMLLVVALITLLISLLLPALGQARENARRAICLQNQRGIYHSFIDVSLSNQGRLPNIDINGPAVFGGQTNWNMPNFVYDDGVLPQMKQYGAGAFCPSNSDPEWHYVNKYQWGLDHAFAYSIWMGRRWPQYEFQVGPHIVGYRRQNLNSDRIAISDLMRQWVGTWTRQNVAAAGGGLQRINNHMARNLAPTGGNVLTGDGAGQWRSFETIDLNRYYKNVAGAPVNSDWTFYLGVLK